MLINQSYVTAIYLWFHIHLHMIVFIIWDIFCFPRVPHSFLAPPLCARERFEKTENISKKEKKKKEAQVQILCKTKI